MSESDAKALWPHQVEALTAVTGQVARGGRTTLVAACGTGKTRIGAAVSAELGARTRSLVVVPTRDLLAQTLQAYRETNLALGTVVAVCGDPTITQLMELHSQIDVTVTTTPDVLVDATRTAERVTVVSTYASLPVIAAAHAHHDLPEWDVVVIDEAHRTTGKVDGPWKLVHHDAQIPARRRLYMTATPRISVSDAEDVTSVSMDDHKIFGPITYRLPFSRAINMGLLADYRVVVPIVTSSEVYRIATDQNLQLRVGGSSVAPAILGGQIAVLRTMAKYGVRRAISYHHRVDDAKVWAKILPEAAPLVPEFAEADLWSGHVSGRQGPHLRRRIIGRLAEPGQGLVVVSNARVLNEGIDVPVVDAVIFARPRDSSIDTIQAVGRALRTGGQPDKTATIVVPLFLTDGENPEAALEGSSWDPVWRTLRALRDHDDRLDEYLRTRRTRLGQEQLMFDFREREETLPAWLRVEGVEVAAELARSIIVRAVRSTTPSWDEYYGAACSYADLHGHLNVPQGWSAHEGLALGKWVGRQRQAYTAENLSAERVVLLEELGIVWNTREASWQTHYEAACRFAREHGHLNVPEDHTTPGGANLANWLQSQRTRHNQGKLSSDRKESLDKIGMVWDPILHRWTGRYLEVKALYDHRGSVLRLPVNSPEAVWLDIQYAAHRNGHLSQEQIDMLANIGVDMTATRRSTVWQNTFEELRAFHAEEGHWDVPNDYTTLDGVNLNAWMKSQRSRRNKGTLAKDRIQALERLGFPWDAKQHLWQTRYRELRAFYGKHGHLNRLPTGPLNSWLYQQRKKHRQGKLPTEAADKLARINPLWHDDHAFVCSDQVRANFRLLNVSWERIAAVLEDSRSPALMRSSAELRTVVEAMLWKVRTGARWEDLPPVCGPHSTVYAWWKQWKDTGVWDTVEELADFDRTPFLPVEEPDDAITTRSHPQTGEQGPPVVPIP